MSNERKAANVTLQKKGAEGWANRIVRYGDAPVAELVANPRNWRLHPREQQAVLSGVMNEVGWVAPVIVNERTGYLVDGHLRVQMAIRNGEATVPAAFVDLSEDEEALILATLDPLAAMAKTDREAQAMLLAAVHTGDLALQELLDGMLENAGGGPERTEDPDATPEPAEEPYVQPGQLWRLGEHRVFVGDSTDPASYRALLGGRMVDVVFTDPPYNVDYGNHSGAAKDGKGTTGMSIMNDSMTDADWECFIRGWSAMILQHCSGAVYVCMSTKEWGRVSRAMEMGGGHWSDTLIWSKERFTLGRADYQRQYEPIWYGWREGVKRQWKGSRKESNLWDFELDRGVVAHETAEGGMRLEFGLGLDVVSVVLPQRLDGQVVLDGGATSDLWRIEREKARYVHPTQKPVALIERALHNSSRRGDAVLDPFLGSGSTLMAAELNDRVCYGIELDPKFAQVAIQRWENFTGKQAELVSGGAA